MPPIYGNFHREKGEKKRQWMDLGVVSFRTRMRCWGRLNSGWVIRTSLKFQLMYLTSTKTEKKYGPVWF